MNDNAILNAIEDMVKTSFTPGDQETRDTLRMVIAACYVGTNQDKLARLLGLNRDKFVRPRARRLRDAGLWVDGEICIYTLNNQDADVWLGIFVASLVAEDLIEVEAAVPLSSPGGQA